MRPTPKTVNRDEAVVSGVPAVGLAGKLQATAFKNYPWLAVGVGFGGLARKTMGVTGK